MARRNVIPTVVILEDESSRRDAMTIELAQRLPKCAIQFFDNAPEMIEWLRAHPLDPALISLDHDLGATREVNGAQFDPGIGRDVAEFLAAEPMICPIIIHSTNRAGAQAMKSTLNDSGWPVSIVIPMNDTRWIHEDWGPAITQFETLGYVFYE